MKQDTTPLRPAAGFSRRGFLGLAGGLAGLGLLAGATGCKSDDDNPDDDKVNLGSGDTGILNYAYALEQLEAAFYAQVISRPYNGMTALEKVLLTDIRDHEVAHREFFRKALGANAIQNLIPNFESVNFGDRLSVLQTARTFEDLGVSAYNGAARLIESADYLKLAGKIVSVEARHAGLIRELIELGSFADSTVLTGDALDVSRPPSEVLIAAQPFLKTKISGSNLPTS